MAIKQPPKPWMPASKNTIMESIRQFDKSMEKQKHKKFPSFQISVEVADFPMTQMNVQQDLVTRAKDQIKYHKRKKLFKDPNESTTEESDYSLQDSDAEWRESFSEEKTICTGKQNFEGKRFFKV